MAAGNEPAEAAAARQHAAHDARRAGASACRSRSHPARPAARGPRARRRRSTRSPRRCGRQGLFMPQSRAAMAVAPRARPAARRARARPLRRARRQDDAPGRADGRRGPGRGRRAPPGPRRGARPHGRAGWAPTSVEVRVGRRRRAAGAPAPTTACSSTRRARTSARSPRAPTRAGARTRRRSPTLAATPGGRSSTPARSARPRRAASLVYSTCTISPAENERRIDGVPRSAPRTSRSTILPSDLPVWDHPRVPRVTQTLPHRDGTDGFFIARLRRGMSGDDHVDLGDVCPACGEPWLRPDQPPRPLPLRELPAPLRAALGVPELRRALDDRAESRHRAVRVQPLPGLDAPAQYDGPARRRAVRSSPPTSPASAPRSQAVTPARGRSTSTSWTVRFVPNDHARPAGRGGAGRADDAAGGRSTSI